MKLRCSENITFYSRPVLFWQVIGSRGQATISPGHLFGREARIQGVSVFTSSEVLYGLTFLVFIALPAFLSCLDHICWSSRNCEVKPVTVTLPEQWRGFSDLRHVRYEHNTGCWNVGLSPTSLPPITGFRKKPEFFF